MLKKSSIWAKHPPTYASVIHYTWCGRFSSRSDREEWSAASEPEQSLPTELRRDVSNAGRQWAVCSAVLRSMGSSVHILIIHGIWHAQPSISLAAKQQIEIKNYEWSLMSLHFYRFGKEHPFTNFNSYSEFTRVPKMPKTLIHNRMIRLCRSQVLPILPFHVYENDLKNWAGGAKLWTLGTTIPLH